MNIIFFGSPEFAVPTLELLQASTHRVLAVVTQPNRPSGRKLQITAPPVKQAAEKFKLAVFQPTTTKTPEFFEQLAAFKPDALIVVAYGEILRSNLLTLGRFGAINVHASLLPKYRGAAPMPWSILQGETETGVTTMLMNETMDAGPILLQSTCAIDEHDTSETMSQKLASLGAQLLIRTVDLVEKDQIKPTPQNAADATFAPKLKKSDGEIDWNKSAQWISRQTRAFNPWPGTYSYLNGHLTKFWKVTTSPTEAKAKPGEVIFISKDFFEVACGEATVLRVWELQPENRPRLHSVDFVNGYHVSKGTQFKPHS
ncbi:MAG: methionyl-tRNA formyltransferase [Acidobacteria bacterium]|nr:MAG: methionyl-tRNA formyltransferase [Acidobacteriota bacterium]